MGYIHTYPHTYIHTSWLPEDCRCYATAVLKNSKSKNLTVNKIEISPYLLDDRFSKQERELLFSLRSRTILVKENFKNANYNNDMLCELCKLFPCTQSHITECPQLRTQIVVDKILKISETFIYSDVDQQLVYVKMFNKFCELRKHKLNEE